ncbi:MAG: hypothetical protein O7D94_09460 [Planctomycetota bacterium]|nr:hypothetical protein [Planctomycetota bacterium]
MAERTLEAPRPVQAPPVDPSRMEISPVDVAASELFDRRWNLKPRAALAATILALVAFAFVSRWWFLPHRLEGWDPLQHALGLRDFDVFRHTPHPPGAPTYHLFLRLIHALVGDATAAVLWSGVALSVLAGLAGFALGVALPAKSGRRTPGLVGLFLLMSPALWLDGVSGGSCAGDAVLAALVGVFCYLARTRRHLASAVGGAAALAILIGFRQNVNLASVCLMPLWIWSLLPCLTRVRLVGLAVFATVCAAWAIPTASACGGWSAWLAPTFEHAGLCNFQGILGGDFTPGSLLSLAGQGEAELGAYLGMLWIPVMVACLCCVLRRGWRASPHVPLTCLWLLPLAAGIVLAPTHLHEYAAVALPILCWWAATGLSHLCHWGATRVQAIGTLRAVPAGSVSRGLLLSSAATIVLCNVFVFLLMRSSDPEADSYYATLGRIGRRFEPASTLIVSSGLGQRYASHTLPGFTSVYLAALEEDPWEPYAGRIFRNGTELTFAGPAGAVPLLDGPVHTVVLTDPFEIVCEPPLVLHDLDGQSRFIDGGKDEITVRYEDGKLIVTAAPPENASASAERGPKGHLNRS